MTILEALFDEVRAAASRIADHVVTTPLLESRVLDELAGRRVFIKAESLQRGGAFKCRGAFNKVLQIPPAQRAAGLIAHSSGNHAMAVSMVAAELGIPATVVMPHDVPAVKVEGCRRLGATIVRYDREHDDRHAIGDRLVAEHGLHLVLPYDDLAIVAGAGTGAIEAFAQLPGGVLPQAILLPCSGGGLASGWAVVARRLSPDAAVQAVEPQGFDDMGRSLREGHRVSNHRLSGSVCDALLAPTPGELTFGVLRSCGVTGLTVSDAEALNAVRFAFEHLKLVVEPSGAVALAALLHGRVAPGEGAVLLAVSGGNLDPEAFRHHLASMDPAVSA